MADKPFFARHGLIVSDNYLVVSNTGKVSIGSNTANITFEVIATDAILIPSGNTGQRPTGSNGYIRYNNQTNIFECFMAGSWQPFGGTAAAANVSGPASSTNNAIALYDGTTGGTIKDSLVTISTTGKITGVAANTTTASLNLPHGTSPTSPVNGDIWTTSTNLNYRVGSTNYTAFPKEGGTLTGRIVTASGVTTNNSSMNTSSTSLGEIEIKNNGTGAAMVAFNRTGSNAQYFGLDTDNYWKVGGWSAGNFAYKIWHEGLFTPVDKAGDTMTGNLNFGVAGASKLLSNGDIYAIRSGNNSGLIAFNNTVTRYLSWDGTNYNLPGANLYISSQLAWHAGNDGSGSGLDADTVDGIQAANLVQTSSNATLNYVTLTGNFTVGSGQTSSLITMSDSNNGNRSIYCDDNVGFLKSDNSSWGSYCQDDGSWVSTVAMYAPIFYDSDNGSYYINPASGSVLNNIQLNHSAWNTSSDTWRRFYFDNGGATYIGCGTTAQTWLLFQTNNGSNTMTTHGSFSGTGDFAVTGNITAYSSDRRLKKNLVEISDWKHIIMNLTGYRFEWNEKGNQFFDGTKNGIEVGLIAQDVQKVLPQAAVPQPLASIINDYDPEDPYLTIQYDKIIPVLVEAIKSLSKEIDNLKVKL